MKPREVWLIKRGDGSLCVVGADGDFADVGTLTEHEAQIEAEHLNAEVPGRGPYTAVRCLVLESQLSALQDEIDRLNDELDEVGRRIYVTGTGQRIRVHAVNKDCYMYGCSVHAPSTHSMLDMPTHWRGDRALMERICEHGIGHPDPDHIAYVRRVRGADAADVEAVHGCDGCCRRNDFPGRGDANSGN